MPPLGSPEHPYSAQKAEVERVLADVLARHPSTAAWIFRPCIVAGPRAQTLLDELPYERIAAALPGPARRLLGSLPLLQARCSPTPAARFQLVHEDDVARAFLAGVHGRGEPGAYNLAADGTLTLGDLAHALGWHALPVPAGAARTAAELATQLPRMPDQLAWLHALRTPVLMQHRPGAETAALAPPLHERARRWRRPSRRMAGRTSAPA